MTASSCLKLGQIMILGRVPSLSEVPKIAYGWHLADDFLSKHDASLIFQNYLVHLWMSVAFPMTLFTLMVSLSI